MMREIEHINSVHISIKEHLEIAYLVCFNNCFSGIRNIDDTKLFLSLLIYGISMIN